MTNQQSTALEILSRLDELERLKSKVTEKEVIETIEEREKALRIALDKHLST